MDDDELQAACAKLGQSADLIAGDDERFRRIAFRLLLDAYYLGKTAGWEQHGEVWRESISGRRAVS